MIGILIVTHGDFGEAILKSAELIIGKQKKVNTLGFNHGDSIEGLRDSVTSSIKKLNDGDGVLILTDLYGGSPSNIAAMNMKNLSVESITGLNLPILLEALGARNQNKLSELIPIILKIGTESIKNIRKEYDI